MTTDFPTSTDTFPSAAALAVATLGSGQHSTLHGNIGDALTAVEAYVLANTTGGGNATEFLDVSQAPFSCDMTGATKSGGNGTARDGSDSTHGFLKAVYTAFVSGKTLWIPPGTIDMRKDNGDAALVWIDFSVHKRRLEIRGCGEAATVLDWSHCTGAHAMGTVTDPTDLVLGGDPSGRIANFAIDAAWSNNTDWSLDISDLTLQGPGGYADPTDAEDRTDGWGVHMGGRIRVERCEITGWHSAVVYRVRVDHNNDHNVIRDCNLHNNFYNMYWSYYWPVSGVNSGDGDHVVDNVLQSQASKACRAVDPAGAVFDSKIVSSHGGFSPFGWYSEFGPQSEVLLSTGTWPGASAAGTVARDAAGLVTIDTKISAIDAPWGPFDNHDKDWNNGKISACGGFIVGDVVDLADIAASGHAAGSLATDSKCTGRVVAKFGTGLTFLMEHPVASSAFSAVTITAGGMTSHYNQARMLDTNVEHDGTYEGCGVSNIFAPNRIVEGFGTACQIPFHGLMSVDNNGGTDNAYSPTPLWSIVRDGSGTVAGKVAAGTAMKVGDNWFINTPHTLAGDDDNPPTSGWQPKAGRVRGVHNILTVTDNTDGGTTLTFTFAQTGSARTIGSGTSGSAGSCGRCASFVMDQCLIAAAPTLDISAHPPDNSSDGGPLAALELVVRTLRKSTFWMMQGVALYPRLMTGTTDAGTEPVRSSCRYGTVTCPITHTTQAVSAGQVLEFSGRDDVRPYQGGWLAGVALWNRTSGDYIAYQSEGYLSASDTTYPMPGVLSSASFAQGDVLVADPTNHGDVLKQDLVGHTTDGFAVVGRAGSTSTSLGGGRYRTSIHLYIVNAIP